MTKIYLASPFFNTEELLIYEEVISILRSKKNVDLFVPMEHEILNAYDISNKDWGKRVFDLDKNAIDDSDVVVVLNYGMYSDSGTAWEAGYAFAKGKRVYHVLCGNDNSDYSLMMINGTGTVMTLEELRRGIVPVQNEILDTINQK